MEFAVDRTISINWLLIHAELLKQDASQKQTNKKEAPTPQVSSRLRNH
jgi:hypothetical protein